MDFFGKMKVTFKGPNSLGGNNENNIAAKYRGIDPSYIGRLDINVCGTSDPGTSAILTPFCQTDGLYFDSKREPETFKYSFDKDVTDYMHNDPNKLLITPSFESSDDYYDSLYKMKELNETCVVSETIHPDKKYIIDINL